MARKPEAPSPAGPKKRKMTPQEQHALFVKTARELGGEEVGEGFERAFDRVVAQPPDRTDTTRGVISHQPSRRSKSRA